MQVSEKSVILKNFLAFAGITAGVSGLVLGILYLLGKEITKKSLTLLIPGCGLAISIVLTAYSFKNYLGVWKRANCKDDIINTLLESVKMS